jgi:hypothetical protein
VFLFNLWSFDWCTIIVVSLKFKFYLELSFLIDATFLVFLSVFKNHLIYLVEQDFKFAILWVEALVPAWELFLFLKFVRSILIA